MAGGPEKKRSVREAQEALHSGLRYYNERRPGEPYDADPDSVDRMAKVVGRVPVEDAKDYAREQARRAGADRKVPVRSGRKSSRRS